MCNAARLVCFSVLYALMCSMSMSTSHTVCTAHHINWPVVVVVVVVKICIHCSANRAKRSKRDIHVQFSYLAVPCMHVFFVRSLSLAALSSLIPCLSSIKQIYMFKWTTYLKWRIIVEYNRLKRPIHLEIIIKLLALQCSAVYRIESPPQHSKHAPGSFASSTSTI